MLPAKEFATDKLVCFFLFISDIHTAISPAESTGSLTSIDDLSKVLLACGLTPDELEELEELTVQQRNVTEQKSS